MCQWPRGGKLYASRMLSQGALTYLGDASRQTVRDFWQSVTNDAIRQWCMEVELPESALAE